MQTDQKDDGELRVQGPDSSGDEGRSDLGKYGPNALAGVILGLGFVTALAFDPGDTTGALRIETSAKLGVIVRQNSFSQEEFFRYLDAMWAGERFKGVVFYEGFVSRNSDFVRTQIAPQNIGVIKYWARRSDYLLVEIQPSQTHRIKREDVKAAGWTWKTEHEFDAIRILIYGLTMLRYR